MRVCVCVSVCVCLCVWGCLCVYVCVGVLLRDVGSKRDRQVVDGCIDPQCNQAQQHFFNVCVPVCACV